LLRSLQTTTTAPISSKNLEMPVTSLEKSLKFIACMKRRVQPMDAAKAGRWARRLSTRAEKILVAHPDADRDNVRHTLILLKQPPLERLQRSLIRGRATAIFRK
jgi:hypothetical protein